MIQKLKVAYSPARLADRVAGMGRSISRDYAGRTLDAIVLLEDSFVFAADLVRKITCPVVCHFIRTETRDIRQGGYPRREIFFSRPPQLRNRHVLLVAAMLHSGIPQDFLVKRLLDSKPRTFRIAVLVDKPAARRVDLKPDYFGFAAASKYVVGYGLTGRGRAYGNLPYLAQLPGVVRRAASLRSKSQRTR